MVADAKAVFPENKKDGEPAKPDKNVSGKGGKRRHMRPGETVVERGDNDERDKSHRRERHDDFLSRLLLGERASAHPALQKRRILFYEVEGDRKRRHEIYRQERPRLPVVERPRRNEQQRRHEQGEGSEGCRAPSHSGYSSCHCSMRPSPDHCCFSQNDSRPCDAEPPITQGMPIATWPSAAAETQPSATAPTPT